MATSPQPPRAQILSDVWLDGRLAVWLSAPRLLVAADLHWGYATSHRSQGNLLPVWGDEDIAGRLDSLIADYQPAEMLWLGDSLHTLAGRTAAEAWLQRAPLPVTIISGNHDRKWARASRSAEHRGGFYFHHGDAEPVLPADTLEIIGHHHPAASWNDGAGGRFKLPALVAGPGRLILPAFSPWAAGGAWNGRLRPGEKLWAIAPHRILSLSSGKTAA